MINNKVRWGIAGLGKIASRFVNDLTQHAENAELYAVAARDQLRADLFADKYKCSKSYGSYLALANDPNVDVVYIGTIHPFHKEMVELFLKKGKHVLVEKPAFTNVKDWDEMSNLAKKQGLLLCEAMKFVTFPAYREMKKFIHLNELQIDSIEAAFGNFHPFDINEQIFNPNLAGGATLDVGVYALWLYLDLCTLTEKEILAPSVRCSQDNPDSKVDENVEFIFDAEVKGKVSASITRDLKREAIIKGAELMITIDGKWWNPKNIDITYKGKKTSITTLIKGGGFQYEIEHISSLIINKQIKSDLIPWKTSRQAITIMESGLIKNGFANLVV